MKKTPPPIPASADFADLVNLLAVYTEASNQLASLQGQANESMLDILDDLKSDYARLQETVTKTEHALEALALRHPDWFAEDRKSIKTPYGTIRFHTSTELDIPNEEAALARLEREAFALFPYVAGVPAAESEFQRSEFLARFTRARVELNKEALETAEDSFLALLGIKKITKQNFSAKPAALDLGKAVKESSRNLPVAEPVARKDAA